MISQALSDQDQSAAPALSVPESWLCPQGHRSTEADFCSECGIKIAIAPDTALEPAPVPESSLDQANISENPGLTCPDCGGPHSMDWGNFCEGCGYNFALGTSGLKASSGVMATEHHPVEGDEAKEAKEVELEVGWAIAITLDPSLWDTAVSPAPPELRFEPVLLEQMFGQDPWLRKRSQLDPAPGSPPSAQKHQILIGRTSQSQAIHPEIALDFDNAVSQRHAALLLQFDRSLSLRDLGSSNGTILNGQHLTPLQDYPLRPGDSFTLGHWTRLTVTLR